MKNIFGEEVVELTEDGEIISSKMTPFDMFNLISRYKYISQYPDKEDFFLVEKKSGNRWFCDSIHIDVADAQKNVNGPDKRVVEKIVDYNQLFVVIRILACHEKLVYFSLMADTLFEHTNNKTIFLMLDEMIPKNKYYVKYVPLAKPETEISQLIEFRQIGTKDAENLIEISELLNRPDLVEYNTGTDNNGKKKRKK